MSKSIYRKAALDRLASPEQLDRLVEVTRPRHWLALGGLGAIIVAGLVWGIFGRIPTTIEGQGILMSSGGIFEVEVLGTGPVEELLVEEGDAVEADELVARIRQPILEQRIEQVEERIEWLRGERSARARFTTRNVELEGRSLERERAGLESRLEAARERAEWLRERVSAEREALDLGLVTEDAVQARQQELESTRGEITALELQLQENEVRGHMLSNREAQDLASWDQRIRDARQEAAALRLEMERTSRVVSPDAGIVRELRADEGQIVSAGEALVSLERVDAPLHAVVFVSTQGKRVRDGMRAQVSPVTVRREEYGYMLGEVEFVSGQPATPQGLMRVLRNPALVQQLSGGGAPFLVEVTLERAEGTPSGFAWSSPQGPPQEVESGTLCRVRIVAAEQRPISLVLPIFRRTLGLAA